MEIQLQKAHLDIYQSFGGDGDGFVRMATADQQKIMSYTHWRTIENLLQGLRMISRGLTSAAFAAETEQEVLHLCENDEVVALLKKMV